MYLFVAAPLHLMILCHAKGGDGFCACDVLARLIGLQGLFSSRGQDG